MQNVYPATVELLWPKAATGRPRKHPAPREDPVAAEAMLENAEWRRVSWRRGTRGPLSAGFAASRMRPAEGEQFRNGRHPPGEEVWLVGERRPGGGRKYYLANLPAEATLRELAAAIKARWVCERAHRQLKEELGLDHFEGRSWTGLHRHALMAMIALAFLQHLRPREGGRADRGPADLHPSPPCPRSGAGCSRGSASPLPAARAAGLTSGHYSRPECPGTAKMLI